MLWERRGRAVLCGREGRAMSGGRWEGRVRAVEVVGGWEAICAVGGVGRGVFDGAAAGASGGGGPAEGLNVVDGILGGDEWIGGRVAVLVRQWEVGTLRWAAGNVL